MKKFFMQFEDLWVAVAFAEAGEYDSLRETSIHALHDAVRVHII
jgi:hypothetical protein